jgi:RNA polymerase sigma-70 factor (ECF subfamily)
LPDHLDRLYRAAYGLCGAREDAEDLVQDTYAQVLKRPRLIRRDDDIAYLLRVLRNTFLEHERGRKRRPVVTPTDEVDWIPGPNEDPTGTLVESRAAFAAIATLTAPLRDTIVAVDVAGLSYKEAARSLRIRQGTVMSRLHRARQRVMELLDDDAA